MLGTDAVAEHRSLYFSSALDDVEIFPAPGGEFYLCVFKISGSFSGTTLASLRDSVPFTYWGLTTQTLRPFLDADPCGVFSVAENQPLILENPSLFQVRLNLTYEIRPVGR